MTGRGRVPFTLLPAVDVAGGRSVRPSRGGLDAAEVTALGDPREAALAWQADGAAWIHLVDLDAAFGRGSNAELLAAVIGDLDVRVELAGGIHDDESLRRAMSCGPERVVLATTAVDDLAWCTRVIAEHGDRIAVSLDVRVVEDPDGSVHHRLAARGGTREGGDVWETIAVLGAAGCRRYIVTDVRRDGMLAGPNVDLYRAVTAATASAVIASGGVSSLDDLRVLAGEASARDNLEGCVVGKALHSGRFTLPQAIAAVRSAAPDPRSH